MQGTKQVTREIDDIDSLLTGDDAYSRHLCATYISNFLRATDVKSPLAYRVCELLEDRPSWVVDGFPARKNAKAKDAVYKEIRPLPRGKVNPEDWKTLIGYFENEKAESAGAKPTPVVENVKRLAAHLNLGPVEQDLLKFFGAMDASVETRDFVGGMIKNDKERLAPLIARMIDRPGDVKAIAKALDYASPLLDYGFLSDDPSEFDDAEIPYCLDYGLRESLTEPDMDVNSMCETLLGKPKTSPLKIGDFEHLGEDLEEIKTLLANAAEKGHKGVNILLFGPPGSGKTELAAALASSLDLTLYAVGEDEESGPQLAKTSTVRLSALQRAQALLKENRNCALLFDEIEDLLLKGTDSSKKADTDNKVQINRLLENNPVVTIWTGNDPEKFHEAVRQRFSYAVFMGYPPTKVRERIWERQMEIHGLQLPKADVTDLARQYAAPPRMISKAVENAVIAGGSRQSIIRSLESASRITYGSYDAIMPETRLSRDYDPALINAGTDTQDRIRDLIERGARQQPFALNVSGAKGAGASSLLRYLAEEMCMNAIEVNMEELAAPHPMMPPETKISNAFLSAMDARAFLIIKGVENIVSNPRSEAGDEWGSSLVSTFERAAAAHRLPYAVTSGADIKLPASFARNFSHAMALKPLDDGQKALAWSRFFGGAAPAGLNDVKNVTPGDFESARLDVSRMGGAADAALAALQDRIRLRQSKPRGIGFGQP